MTKEDLHTELYERIAGIGPRQANYGGYPID
jgi:hypothetical protein